MTAERVEPDSWAGEARRLAEGGCDWFGSLVGIDDPAAGEIELVLSVARTGTLAEPTRTCRLPREEARIDSIAGVWPGAEFAEREVAEMLGVEFTGHPDPRPLLLPDGVTYPPLRRDAGLARRAQVPWPGAHEPGEDDQRRRRPTRAIASDDENWQVSL